MTWSVHVQPPSPERLTRPSSSNGTGAAHGIYAINAITTRIEANHLASPTPGNSVGITGSSSTVCMDNSVLGYNTAIVNCALGGGNVTL